MTALNFDIIERLRGCPEVLEMLNEATGDTLRAQKTLRARYPADLVRAACLLSDLRRRAAGKFSRADRMWFDAQGLEQSTCEVVARHKAQRFAGHVWDLCSGIGGDALALSEHAEVSAVDTDPFRTRCVAWNAEVYGVVERVKTITGDIMEQCCQGGLIHVDPDRRAGTGVRARRIDGYSPGPEILRALMARALGGAIKVSPASDFGRTFGECEIELVSVEGECKEATVWFGTLATGSCRRATVLPAGVSLAGDETARMTERRELGSYLYDPDPAVVRAGLVDALAEKFGLYRLDAVEEYLTSDARVSSPFVRRYVVKETTSPDEKKLRRRLRELNIGPLEIKSRRLPINHETSRQRLRPGGDDPATVVFAYIAGRSRAILCHRDAP